MFRGRLYLSMQPGQRDNRYIVDRDLWFTNDEYDLMIPAGTPTDGASIPRALWSIVGSPFTGKYTPAAVLHDWLYLTGIYSRKESDQILYKAMIASNVPLWKADIICTGVRAGGWVAWNKHRNA